LWISHIRLTRKSLLEACTNKSLGTPTQSPSWRDARQLPTVGSKLHVERISAYDDTNPAGSLRSTGITRLRRYYEPLRLPTWPKAGYEFPVSVGGGSSEPCTRHAGSLRFLVYLSTPAVLNHPGGPGRCTCSWLRGRCWLHHLRKDGHPQQFNEAESGSLTLRLTPLRSEASDAGLPRRLLGQLHGARALTMVSTFQLTRQTRLSLTHRRKQR
jgi:hypothetical protein